MTKRLWRSLLVVASAALAVGINLMTSLGVPPTFH